MAKKLHSRTKLTFSVTVECEGRGINTTMIADGIRESIKVTAQRTLMKEGPAKTVIPDSVRVQFQKRIVTQEMK